MSPGLTVQSAGSLIILAAALVVSTHGITLTSLLSIKAVLTAILTRL